MTPNPATPPPSIVNYKLSDGDVSAIAAQLPRDTGGVLRNQVLAGDVYPAMVVRTFDPSVTTSNLQVFLDGNCTFWATSRVEGTVPGTWSRPAAGPTAPAPDNSPDAVLARYREGQ
ncbi:hypothetical protein [Kutzneria buriramensis]|uniref:Uncharacterized protein n=1 Tax=Kutzneria buriramensis TaxID=1045776 RepID=A0A3E0HEP1_9PSEU|nr:hypothetical protein [Kutzneria buriramensis]REH43633.1 hypothetical protein BCF44_109176 [Kutzneria buriramensis]